MTAFADAGGKMLAHTLRDKELFVFRPAVVALGQTDLIFAQRFAVGFLGVLLMRSAISDVAIDNDQGWAVWRIQEVL